MYLSAIERLICQREMSLIGLLPLVLQKIRYMIFKIRIELIVAKSSTNATKTALERTHFSSVVKVLDLHASLNDDLFCTSPNPPERLVFQLCVVGNLHVLKTYLRNAIVLGRDSLHVIDILSKLLFCLKDRFVSFSMSHACAINIYQLIAM